jgi:AraC family transcriptional regulator
MAAGTERSPHPPPPPGFAKVSVFLRALTAIKALVADLGSALNNQVQEDRMTEYKIIETEAKTYLYVDKHTNMKPEDISKAMGEAFGEVFGFMQKNGIAPTGGALSVYYTYNPEKVDFRAGFFISAEDAGKAEGEIKSDETPATKVLHFVHKGPYSGLTPAYENMMAHMQKEGLTMSTPTWEVYLNGPDTVPESEFLTEIYCALA